MGIYVAVQWGGYVRSAWLMDDDSAIKWAADTLSALMRHYGVQSHVTGKVTMSRD